MTAGERAARERLAKILAVALRSPVAGEQIAALARALPLIERLGGVETLLGVEPAIPPASWRALVAALLRQPTSLTEWERKFLASLAGYPADRMLSAKQTKLLADIAEQVGARAPGRAA